jgi:hypothetical protein
VKKMPKRALHCKRGVMSRKYDDRSKYSPGGPRRLFSSRRPYRVNVNDLSPEARRRAELANPRLERARPYDER